LVVIQLYAGTTSKNYTTTEVKMYNTGSQSAGKNLAWFAGFVCGDGSISLSKQRMGKNRAIYTPKIGVSNTDHSLIEVCANILKDINVGFYINDSKTKNGTARHLNVKGFKRVSRLLPLLIPELKGKKKLQAQLLLEWIKSREQTGNNHTYTANEVLLYEQILDLKKPD
jgi:hypothetical protein